MKGKISKAMEELLSHPDSKRQLIDALTNDRQDGIVRLKGSGKSFRVQATSCADYQSPKK